VRRNQETVVRRQIMQRRPQQIMSVQRQQNIGLSMKEKGKK
jgi:hypothetical protein